MPFVGSVEGRFGYGNAQQVAGGEVITSNLQVWLDAGSNTSYPGSGAAWSNLVAGASAYNFGLSNSPVASNVTYNGTTNRAISFDGINDYAVPNTSLLTLAQASGWAETREYWVYWRGTAGCLTMESGSQQVDLSWFDAQAAMSNNQLVYSVWQGNIGMTPYIVYTGITSNTWNHIIWQNNKATNTLSAYVNGVQTYLNNGVSRTTPDSVGTGFFPTLMAGSATNFGYGSASYMSGALGVFRWYNSFLSSNQINSNYNAERARFGR
jgi:hypothetical protein